MARSDVAAPASAGFSARFDDLKRHFVGGLPARWAAIQQAAPGAPQQAELHRLAGAAGSFGYAALGEAARVAERCSEADTDAALSMLQTQLFKSISPKQAPTDQTSRDGMISATIQQP